MLVPIKWLKEYTEVNMAPQEWVDGMVLSGTNLESVEYWDKGIENVVVGQILKIEPHPNAEKLVVCQVNSQYQAKKERTISYLQVVNRLLTNFL